MRYPVIFGLFALSLLSVGCQSNSYRTYSENPYCDGAVDEVYVHRYGVEVPADEWETRGKSGKVLSQRRDGVNVSQSFVRGVLDGEVTYSFPHTQEIEKIETYKLGNLVKELTYYRTKSPMQEIQYHEDNCREITTWYDSGQPQSIEEYIGETLVNGQYFNLENQVEAQVTDGAGMRICRDQYGQSLYHDRIEDGDLVERMTFYTNGAPEAITPYRNRVVDGIRRTFFPGGEPKTAEEWVGGVQHGTTVVFNNGERYADVTYVYGVKEGIEKRFRDGSVIIEEVSWKNDQKHGPSHVYIGEKIQTDWFHKGSAVSKGEYARLQHPKHRPAS